MTNMKKSHLPPLSLERAANQPAITEFFLNKKEKLQNRQQSRVIEEKQVSREERMEGEKTKQEKKNQAEEQMKKMNLSKILLARGSIKTPREEEDGTNEIHKNCHQYYQPRASTSNYFTYLRTNNGSNPRRKEKQGRKSRKPSNKRNK